MRFFVGTSGYSYKEWIGSFYPEKTKAADMLGLYSARFPTVEINNTFYRMPRDNVVAQWAERAGEPFQFSVKAPRRITHSAKLEGADESVEFLLKALKGLGDKLGPVLFQLPPHFRQDVDRLRAFADSLRAMDAEQRVVMEFRHASWYDDATYDALRDAKFALCHAVADATKPVTDPVLTTDWGYVRFREDAYAAEDLTRWRAHLAAQDVGDLYVYFKHDDAGPVAADAFQRLAP